MTVSKQKARAQSRVSTEVLAVSLIGILGRSSSFKSKKQVRYTKSHCSDLFVLNLKSSRSVCIPSILKF